MIHWLTCFRVSCELFLVLFWMVWMVITVHMLCHVPHTSRITTWGTIFTERHFNVFKEWVRSWSHVFLITYQKTFTKKLFGGPSRCLSTNGTYTKFLVLVHFWAQFTPGKPKILPKTKLFPETTSLGLSDDTSPKSQRNRRILVKIIKKKNKKKLEWHLQRFLL